MNSNIKFLALGGLEESGKNLYCLEIDDHIYVIDVGLKYPDSVNLGVDIIIPNINYLKENINRVVGYFITHGHDDAMGALPIVLKECPGIIYCGAATKQLIEYNVRNLTNPPKFVFEIIRHKKTIELNGIQLIFIRNTHSIIDTFSIAFKTKDGIIFYTSDFIFDFEAPVLYRSDVMDYAVLGRLGVLAMICDSSSANHIGQAAPNNRLTPHIKSLFEFQTRIIISCYAQNFYAIHEIIALIDEYDCYLYLYGETTKSIIGIYQNERPEIFDAIKIVDKDYLTDTNTIVLMLGNGEDLYHTINDALESNALNIKTEDHIVLASVPVPGNEIVHVDTLNKLYKTGAHVITVEKKKINSMHPHQDDIALMINLLRPKYFIPVKGEFQKLGEARNVALRQGIDEFNVPLLTNGMQIAITDNGVEQLEQFNAESVLVSNGEIGDINEQALEERVKLGGEGALVISIVVDSKNRIVKDIEIDAIGINLATKEQIFESITKLTKKVMEKNFTSKNPFVVQKVEMQFFEYTTNELRKEYKIDPMILTSIIDVSY